MQLWKVTQDQIRMLSKKIRNELDSHSVVKLILKLCILESGVNRRHLVAFGWSSNYLRFLDGLCVKALPETLFTLREDELRSNLLAVLPTRFEVTSFRDIFLSFRQT